MRELVKSVFSKRQIKTFFEFCSNTSCNFQKNNKNKTSFFASVASPIYIAVF